MRTPRRWRWPVWMASAVFPLVLACKPPVSGGGPGVELTGPDSAEASLLPEPIPPVRIEIAADGVKVDGSTVVDVRGGKVDAITKRDGPDGFFIDPLFRALQKVVQRRRAVAKKAGLRFRGEAIIAGAKGTPYRLVAEVLYTANQAELQTYTFLLAPARPTR